MSLIVEETSQKDHSLSNQTMFERLRTATNKIMCWYSLVEYENTSKPADYNQSSGSRIGVA